MPRILVLSFCLLVACSCSSRSGWSNHENRYALTGTVVRLSPSLQTAVIRHETILAPDGSIWMEAETMEFPVRDRAEFSKLQVGRKIRATVHHLETGDYWIEDIQVDELSSEPKGARMPAGEGRPPDLEGAPSGYDVRRGRQHCGLALNREPGNGLARCAFADSQRPISRSSPPGPLRESIRPPRPAAPAPTAA